MNNNFNRFRRFFFSPLSVFKLVWKKKRERMCQSLNNNAIVHRPYSFDARIAYRAFPSLSSFWNRNKVIGGGKKEEKKKWRNTRSIDYIDNNVGYISIFVLLWLVDFHFHLRKNLNLKNHQKDILFYKYLNISRDEMFDWN